MKKLALILSLLVISSICFAKESVWKEMQCIDIPSNAVLKEGTTTTGNPKYWFEFDQIGKVSVSASSAIQFKEKKVTLQLVKWQNKENGEYKYSIRQKKNSKETKNIDLLTIFK